MGLFNLFKKPTIIQDDFFGHGHFTPTNSEVEYLIQADIEGPTENSSSIKGLACRYNILPSHKSNQYQLDD